MARPRRKWYVDFFRGGFYYRTYAPMGYFERTEAEALQGLRLWQG